MNIIRITRHFCLAFRKSSKEANPTAFKKNGEIRKNAKLAYSREMIITHSLYARAYNIALSKGVDLSHDIVCGSLSYNV